MKILKYPSHLAIIAVITTAFIFNSCSQEPDIEVVDPELIASFDAKFDEAVNLMWDQPDLALQKFDVIISESKSLNSKFHSGKAKLFKAYIYDGVQEDVSSAYFQYNEALKDLLETGNSKWIFRTYNNLGILYKYYNQYDNAIAVYQAATSLEDKIPSDELSDLYFNYGKVLELKGDKESFYEAERIYTKALEYAKETDYHENIASVNIAIGLMYKALGNYEMARAAYKNIIETYGNNSDLRNYIGVAYHNIGDSYMDEDNLEAAVRSFKKALEFKESSSSIFITKYDLGTVLTQRGQVEEGIQIWKEALKEKHNKNNIEQVKIYSDLTNALKARGQFEEALAYSEIYNANVENMIAKGETYKAQSDEVIFANVVKEYEEFNRPVPLFSRPLVIVSTIALSALFVYLIVFIYYRSRARKSVTEAVSEIQSEFLNIKVE